MTATPATEMAANAARVRGLIVRWCPRTIAVHIGGHQPDRHAHTLATAPEKSPPPG